MQEILPIFFVVALVAGLGYLLWLGDKKRKTGLQALAQRLGLHFDPQADWRLEQRFGHSVFRNGHSQRGTNALYGSMRLADREIHVQMGDFQYVTGSGKHRHTHRISYATFLLPFRGTPYLFLRKENIGDKIIGGIGFDDIDFESEEFSRKFWVKSDEKKYAYDVIHPGMMEFLLRGPTPRVEIVHDVCLILDGSSRWSLNTFEGAPRWFEEFLGRWPEHLTETLESRSG